MSRPRFPKEKFLLVVLLLLNNALVIPISIFSQELAVQLMQIIRKPGIEFVLPCGLRIQSRSILQ